MLTGSDKPPKKGYTKPNLDPLDTLVTVYFFLKSESFLKKQIFSFKDFQEYWEKAKSKNETFSLTFIEYDIALGRRLFFCLLKDNDLAGLDQLLERYRFLQGVMQERKQQAVLKTIKSIVIPIVYLLCFARNLQILYKNFVKPDPLYLASFLLLSLTLWLADTITRRVSPFYTSLYKQAKVECSHYFYQVEKIETVIQEAQTHLNSSRYEASLNFSPINT